jgi:hypothetical protein
MADKATANKIGSLGCDMIDSPFHRASPRAWFFASMSARSTSARQRERSCSRKTADVFRRRQRAESRAPSSIAGVQEKPASPGD